MNKAIGYYEGTNDDGQIVKVERYVDPARDGAARTVGLPAIFGSSVNGAVLSEIEFDRLLLDLASKEILDKIDSVVELASAEAIAGLADTAPISEEKWRRGILLSWHHSRDITTIMTALGHPADRLAKHDLEEHVLGKRIKEHLAAESSDWYKNWVNSLNDDAEINIGFFNPNLSASLYKWGDDKLGKRNGIDAHTLSDHHYGTPEHAIDWVERAVNVVIHNLPREHYGIRHEALLDWSELPARMTNDKAFTKSTIVSSIALDVAALMKLLEQEGKIMPWHLLRVNDPIPPVSAIEHAVLQLTALAESGHIDPSSAILNVSKTDAQRAPSSGSLESKHFDSEQRNKLLRTLSYLPEAIEREDKIGKSKIADKLRYWSESLKNMPVRS